MEELKKVLIPVKLLQKKLEMEKGRPVVEESKPVPRRWMVK